MKIAIIGYGKMGKMVEMAAKRRGHDIVSIIDVGNKEDFDGIAFGTADVAIEFTSPVSAYENVLQAFHRGVKVVSGSTGWYAAHADEMRRLCEGGGHTLLWSSNFSVGVAIFSAINKRLAHIMNAFPQYDISITETHHVHKIDSPSGTAITLAEQILEAVDRKNTWTKGLQVLPDGTSTKPAAVADDAIEICSVRVGEVPGTHTVAYDSAADGIAITHEAHSRDGFALGAVLAAEYVAEHCGLLSIDDVFAF